MNISTIVDARVVSEKAFTRKTSGATPNTITKIRLADNPSVKSDRNPTRFLNGEAWGKLGEQLAKLSKGDVISVTGELKIEAYKDKDGNERADDVLTISHFRVQKSDSFFGGKKAEAPADTADIPF